MNSRWLNLVVVLFFSITLSAQTFRGGIQGVVTDSSGASISGAAGYLNKQSAPDQLVDAIRLVASGKKYISPEVAQELASQVSGERFNTERDRIFTALGIASADD